MSTDPKHESHRDLLSDPMLRDVPTVEGYKVLDRRYVLFETLGQGGMGVVYRGQHGALDIEVAVKCLDSGLVRRNAEFVLRFEKEARAAARIQHQNVVRVYDVSEEGGLNYIVMEYVQGEDARKRVARKGPLDSDESARLILGAARGLAAAHAIGVVHRDIKPDNILISVDGVVKVADLGLAKDVGGDSGLTYSGATMGTPRYMPPEQYGDAKSVGPAADVYSLGATLYYLLTGEDGIDGNSLMEVVEQVRTQPFPDPRKVNPKIPAALADLVAACTKRDPSERLPDARAVVLALEKLSFGRGTDLSDAKAGSKDAVSMISPPPAQTIARIRKTVTDQDSGLSAGRDEPPPERSARQAPAIPPGPQPEGESPASSQVESGDRQADRRSPESQAKRKGERSGGKWIAAAAGLLAVGGLLLWGLGVFNREEPSGPGDEPFNPSEDDLLSNGDEVNLRDSSGLGEQVPGLTGLTENDSPGQIIARTYTLGSWADVLTVTPDPRWVADAAGRDRMLATGLPWKVRDRDTGIVMLLVPPGEDLIGAAEDDEDAYSGERPAHRVIFPEPFYMGQYEVTQSQWQAVMNDQPAANKGGDRPVEQVSWDAINAESSGFLDRTGMRLPCDCEWEYACRAGSDDARYGEVDEIAWYRGNSADYRHHNVGTAQVNGWGFNDLLGNVAEWCSTVRDRTLYSRAKEQEPIQPGFCAAVEGRSHIQRGGSWSSDAASVRASVSSFGGPTVSDDRTGFRVVREP